MAAGKRRKVSAPPPPPAALPPPHLSERSKALWRVLVPREAKTVRRLTLLQAALEALDRGEECRAVLAREGLTKTTERTGAVHVHPLAKVELECRRQFTRIWDQLRLTQDPYSPDGADLDLGPYAAGPDRSPLGAEQGPLADADAAEGA